MLSNKIKSFPILTVEERHYMMVRELFIHKQLSDPKTFRKNILYDKFPAVSDKKIEEELSKESLYKKSFRKEADLWCQYCSNREFCAAYYSSSEY